MIKAIVTDIEGTTTRLSFVKEVLFPYAHQYLPDYIKKNQHTSAVHQILNEARRLLNNNTLTTEALIQQFLLWIEQDQKITPLKTLQGLIWQEGYQSEKLKSHVYPDAIEQLLHWHQQGIMLAIFSSGSILAQKLLFSHTEQGSLTYLFSHYFDTTTGAKNKAASYQKIAEQIGLSPHDILFLSDTATELDAALQAGMRVCGLAREHAISPSHHFFAKDFHEIYL